MTDSSEKHHFSIQHLSIVICGYINSGKFTTTNHLMFALGGISDREMQFLSDEAEKLQSSLDFSFYINRIKEERGAGVLLVDKTDNFYTATKQYTIIDGLYNRNFIKNMIMGTSQADVALIIVPCDDSFKESIKKKGEGGTRQHALLMNLLGVKQIIVGINKCDVVDYSETIYNEVKNKMIKILIKAGYEKQFVENSVPFIPMSSLIGDNLLRQSINIPWYKGQVVVLNERKVMIFTLLDALEEMQVMKRPVDAPMRTVVSGVYKIKGLGDVITGRVEQGIVNEGDEVVFLPLKQSGRVSTIEIYRKPTLSSKSGDNSGFNIKGLVKENMPKMWNVMVLKGDESIGRAVSFTVWARVLEHVSELKVGYSPFVYGRGGKAAVRMVRINRKVNKEGDKVEDIVSLQSGDFCEAVFEVKEPFVVDVFERCEGLGIVGLFEGVVASMIGKIVDVEYE